MRGSEMNHYIANLNTIPSPQDDVSQQDCGNLEEELALFTNTEFLFKDFDPNAGGDGKNVGFDEEFPLNDFTFAQRVGDDPSNLRGPMQTFSGQPTPGPGRAFFPSPIGTSHPQFISSASATSPKDGHASSGPQSPVDPLEASSRAAAEEDKRRRNTAASARFRVKKKQREQALEKTAKEMSDRAEKLEAKISELQRENKWLRGLVVEKSGAKEEDVGKLLEQVTETTRKADGLKKGVGTENQKAEEEKA